MAGAPQRLSGPLGLAILVGWAAFYPWKSAGRPWYSLAKGFTIGQMPGLVPPQNLRAMRAEHHEQFITLLANCMTGYRTFAHDYLVWGRMQRPLTLDVPQRKLSSGPGGARQRHLVVPAVSHEVWSLDDGRVGVVFVNPEREAHELDVDLGPLVAGGGKPGIRELSTQRGTRDYPTAKIHLEIAPLDMLLLEISP